MCDIAAFVDFLLFFEFVRLVGCANARGDVVVSMVNTKKLLQVVLYLVCLVL